MRFFQQFSVPHCNCLLGFTGIDSAYEPPLNPDLVIKAGEWSVQESVDKVVDMLAEKVQRSERMSGNRETLSVSFVMWLVHVFAHVPRYSHSLHCRVYYLREGMVQ